MHIRRLDIQNFRAIGKLPIRFEDGMGRFRPITVISGPNGCGKTSILVAIVQALRGAMRLRIPDLQFPSDLDLHRAELSGIRPVTATVEMDLEYDQSELQAIRGAFQATAGDRQKAGKRPLDPPPLPEGRLNVQWQYPPRVLRDGSDASVFDLRSKPDFGAVWLAGFSNVWGAWKNGALNDITKTYQVGGLRRFPQDREGRWGVDFEENDEQTSPPYVDDPPVATRNGEPGEHTVVDSLEKLWRFRYDAGLAETDDRRQWEAVLQKRFGDICTPKSYKGFHGDHPRYGKSPILADGPREYPYSRASGGERVILDYLIQLTFPHPVRNSIILIDEPELHLHPRWMRQLFQLFAQSAKPIEQGGDNNQFILTTHSPELRQLAAGQNALIDLGDLGGEGVHAG